MTSQNLKVSTLEPGPLRELLQETPVARRRFCKRVVITQLGKMIIAWICVATLAIALLVSY